MQQDALELGIKTITNKREKKTTTRKNKDESKTRPGISCEEEPVGAAREKTTTISRNGTKLL
jgi:hypothetical protein